MSILAASHITKRFPGVRALTDVSFAIQKGSCHALMGENGAGKSTLGKIFAGIYTPDEGTVLLDDKPIRLHNPQIAVAAGIAMVHQELLFAENMSVAENLCLGNIPHTGPFVDRRAMRRQAEQWLSAIDANIDPDQQLGELTVSKQQLVQIAGGIGQGARTLIFDEPTSSLAQAEVQKLLDLIRELSKNGVTCVYVSHRLDEIFALCDTVTVLRDGVLVDTVPIEGLTQQTLVRMMIGRDLVALSEEPNSLNETTHRGATPENPLSSAAPQAQPEELLRVESLTSPGKFKDASFSIRRGEIVGVAGLVGAGRTELTEAIFGLDAHVSGKIFVKGAEVRIRSPIQAMSLGIGLAPEDRKRHGLVLSMNVRENLSLPTLDAVSVGTWVDRSREATLARTSVDQMHVKAPSIESPTIGLSGGNQQKLVIAKWLAADSDLLIVDEPTRGVDVGAKAEIHLLLRQLAREGKALLVVSSELPELLALSQRILVMRAGQLVGEISREDATEEKLMRLMAGIG